MREVIERLVDDSEFEEYKAGYGKTILTGYARIQGWAVGIVANQRKIVKTKQGEMQFGGVIYSDSADKATRFIANCNQKKIPDRKSTRLNSSHVRISYAVFCLKKKKKRQSS